MRFIDDIFKGYRRTHVNRFKPDGMYRLRICAIRLMFRAFPRTSGVQRQRLHEQQSRSRLLRICAINGMNDFDICAFLTRGSVLIAGPERVQPRLESRRGHHML